MSAAPGGWLPVDAPADPWELLDAWLPANDVPERPQLTLSTVTPEGVADARTLLLTEYDREGFYVHTDARSRKVADIAANPGVAITLLWPNFTRQLVVQGRAEIAADAELASAYERRSPYLKQLAWLNSIEFAQLPLEERVAQWGAFQAEHDGQFEQPTTWIGYLIRPTRMTFWGSNPDTASRRAEYTLVDGAWRIGYLAG